MGKGWPVDLYSRSQTSNVTKACISRSKVTKDVDEPLVTVMSVNGTVIVEELVVIRHRKSSAESAPIPIWWILRELLARI